MLGATLLTKGDYSRDVKWGGEVRQLGSSQKHDSWMDMLTTGKRDDLTFIREPLMALLDDYSTRRDAGSAAGRATLDAIRADWLAEREDRSYYDWRYYLSRYEGARSSVGDGYFHNKAYDRELGGFSYRHLRIFYGGSYVSYFSDAILRAAWVDGELKSVAEEPRWFREADPGLKLRASGIEIRCEEDGFRVAIPPEQDGLSASAGAVLSRFGATVDGFVPVQQALDGLRQIDSEDRVQLCVRIVNLLAAAGL